MILESQPAWPVILLALVLLGDALLSIKPAQFIRVCLTGVNFPENWWWALVYIKLLAAMGLVAGIWFPGVGVAANVGVIAYFVAAVIAHLRANFLGSEFWVNCLGMLALSIASLVLTLAL